jgi:hypothetical protein
MLGAHILTGGVHKALWMLLAAAALNPTRRAGGGGDWRRRRLRRREIEVGTARDTT